MNTDQQSLPAVYCNEDANPAKEFKLEGEKAAKISGIIQRLRDLTGGRVRNG